MKESTKRMMKMHGWRIDKSIHNYIYFAYSFYYVKFCLFCIAIYKNYFLWLKPLTYVVRMAFNRYHGKVMSFNDTKKIFNLEKDFVLESSENKKIIPYKYAYSIIFDEPEHIAVMDCACKRANNVGADEPVDCCIAVGKHFTTFWLDHCKRANARRISQDEAIEIIRKFRKTGHVTQAFLKVATGGRTGLICNCHPDNCVALQAIKLTKGIRKDLTMCAESGYSMKIDEKKCNLCGRCVKICPSNAVTIIDKKIHYSIDTCLGCELCLEQCTPGAISSYRDQNKLMPLDLDLLRRELAN